MTGTPSDQGKDPGGAHWATGNKKPGSKAGSDAASGNCA